MAEVTAAQRHLEELQQRKPPRYGKLKGRDRAQQLYDVLQPELPPKLAAMVASGAVAIGEVGDSVPDVRTIPLRDGGFVIVFTSGMMDFQYAVARALAGLDQNNARLSVAPQSIDNVARLVARVLRQWARYMSWHWLWPWRRIKWADFPITRETRDWIEMIVTMGELSLLAHELGHVALESKLAPPVSGNSESDADRYGLQFLLPAAEKHWHKRVAYAGPVIPIRFLGALQRLGVEFSDHYPPPAQRIDALRQQIRRMCPSDQYFYEVQTIMVSYQDMVDDIENKIDPGSPPALPDPERMLVRLIAELEEVAKGSVTLATFVQNIRYLSSAIPHITIRQATKMLVDMYGQVPPPQDSFIAAHVRIGMAAKLHQLIQALPPDLRPLFP